MPWRKRTHRQLHEYDYLLPGELAGVLIVVCLVVSFLGWQRFCQPPQAVAQPDPCPSECVRLCDGRRSP